jgi:hypothetical protein
VRHLQAMARLHHHLEAVRRAHRPVTLDVLGERRAAEQLHRDPRHAEVGIDARREHLDDVIALDAAGDARLLDEARAHLRVARERGVHELDGARLAR